MILTNFDDVSENKPFNSICIISALLCYTSGVTVPPIGTYVGTYIAENKKKKKNVKGDATFRSSYRTSRSEKSTQLI